MTDRDTHADIELLLPWYVNGTLSSADLSRVEEHLHNCADCKEAASIFGQMQDAVQQDGPIPIMPTTTAAQIMDGVQKSTFEKVRWQRWGIAASIGLVATLLMWPLGPVITTDNSNQQFDVATAAAGLATVDYVLELRFAEDVTVSVRRSIIEDLGGRNASINADETLFHVVVRLPPKSLQELEQYAADVRSRREVTSARIVALQLPVR